MDVGLLRLTVARPFRVLRANPEAPLQLADLGWDDFFERSLEPHRPKGLTAGRVAVEHRTTYELLTGRGALKGEIAGRLRHGARSRDDLPAVGDWVAIDERSTERATIHAVLPRRTRFVRKVAGTVTEEQIVAANVDTVFVLSSLNQDLNERRLERYLTVAWESGASPVVVLTKSDLGAAPSADAHAALGVPVHALSALTGEGVDALRGYFARGRTVALLGSSGVGKSTLVNALLGTERQEVRPIREGDDKGRHTTTRRELFLLPGGGLVIDTPGMRELQLAEGEDGLDVAFLDLATLAEGCRFKDCRHEVEPGCALVRAVESGELDPGRLESWRKLARELAFVARKQATRARREERGQGRKARESAFDIE